MKKVSVLLALMALLFTDAILAASAVATSVTGSVQVQTGSATARPLRQGDEVVQGDTVSTGASSSAVLKFDDGQIAALTANSRMSITAYQFNPQAGSGNVLLSLISGGMRAITGIIGRNQPSQVAYRAATATIGIRGTDTVIATADGVVVVTVSSGEVAVTFEGKTITIRADEGAVFRPGSPAVARAAAEILRQLPPNLGTAVGGLQGLIDAINRSGPGEPRSGPPSGGLQPGATQGLPPGPPSFTPAGGGGGGAPSKS
jgi:hypothetical protein